MGIRDLSRSSSYQQPVPEVIKLFSCSVEHGILNAHKYKNIKKFVFFFRLRKA